VSIERTAHYFIWAEGTLIAMVHSADYAQRQVGYIERPAQRVGISLQYGVAHIVYQVILVNLDKGRRCVRSPDPDPAVWHSIVQVLR